MTFKAMIFEGIGIRIAPRQGSPWSCGMARQRRRAVGRARSSEGVILLPKDIVLRIRSTIGGIRK